jgi:hypothetical protein
MKILLPHLILILVISSCSHHKGRSNQFESTRDTLIIECKKQKGDGLFEGGVTSSDFTDSTAEFDHTVIYPEQLTDIKRDQMNIDIGAEKPDYIDLIIGNLGKLKAFVVDENNNQDFRDDSIRILKPIVWNNDNDLIKCKFFRSIGQVPTLDSSWIRIGEMDNDVWYGKCEHLIAEFNIGNNSFKVGANDLRTGWFEYKESTEIALIRENKIEKDTLLEKNLLKIGEFLNLNGIYYRFASVNKNGDYLTLIKEQNFSKEIGTQVGMIAPDFRCKTVSGDTIRSSDLHDKILLIANSCGCGGDEKSTRAFYDMRNLYADKIVIIRLDSEIEKESGGMQIDVDDRFNKDIHQKYRNMYCSRTCYVIDKSNRIIDKFPIADWVSNLPKNLADH